MNKHDLTEWLVAEKIRADAYDLGGDPGSERYVLCEAEGGWEVFYSERGLKTGLKTFSSETEACEHLRTLIARDPTTRN